jgi:hypothetical protein
MPSSKYRVIHEKMSIFLEVIVSVIVRNNHTNLILIMNVY